MCSWCSSFAPIKNVRIRSENQWIVEPLSVKSINVPSPLFFCLFVPGCVSSNCSCFGTYIQDILSFWLRLLFCLTIPIFQKNCAKSAAINLSFEVVMLLCISEVFRIRRYLIFGVCYIFLQSFCIRYYDHEHIFRLIQVVWKTFSHVLLHCILGSYLYFFSQHNRYTRYFYGSRVDINKHFK